MLKNNRRITYALMAIVLATVAIVACLFIEAYSKDALNSEIEFSYESGFYDAPIEVELSVGKNYFLTYTLDGRMPNAASARYEGPILLEDASNKPNVWSDMKETSLRYYEGGYYGLPEDKVDKCVLLRVAAFDYSGNLANTESREYFIDYNNKPGYECLYTLSVSSDPENFFSDENGIYFLGSYYRSDVDSCDLYDVYETGIGWHGEDKFANWCVSGRESERPATIELFNPEGDLLFREACGVRVRGGESRGDVQKPLGFYAREEYAGNERFSYDLFKDGYGPHSFLAHSLGNDCDVKLVDYVIYNALAKGENTYTVTPMIPCNLFLEGEYWGPMFLIKDLNATTISEDFGVNVDNVLLTKSENVKLSEKLLDLQETELQDWKNLQEFIRNNDMSIQKNYDYVCSKMDIKDFAEYAATEVYIGNADWHSDNNYACWRTLKSEKDNAYADGKWRFCLFDVNWSFESDEVIWQETYEDWDFYHMIRCLCKNEEFKNLYLDKIAELEVTFASDKVEAIIDEWSSFMEEPIRCNFKRFSINYDADTAIQEKKNQIIDFCANRPESISTLNSYFFN